MILRTPAAESILRRPVVALDAPTTAPVAAWWCAGCGVRGRTGRGWGVTPADGLWTPASS